MRSPREMMIIQIDITNACANSCSNCTRFCGHHTKPFFMDFETFKTAVNSLDDYKGCVGIIGGEPTLHPEFEKFADYIGQRRLGKAMTNSRKPILDMVSHMDIYLRDFIHGRNGLWNSLNNGYYKHFETINDNFETQCLNDHKNTCRHQALLMDRKDLGISDEEWIIKRENCWIQNTWSATITPKGAFFCEVAASLDMLFNGPGGWEVTNDWWKRDVKDFKDQLHWCELCSGCLDVPQRLSTDGRDDITISMLKKLQDINSPKIKRGSYILWDNSNYDKSKYKTFVDIDEYMSGSNGIRTSSQNRNIYPKSFTVVSKNDLLTKELPKDWIVLSENENEANLIAENLRHFIINPGCLYRYKNSLLFNTLARSLRDEKQITADKLLKLYPQDKIITLDEIPSAFPVFSNYYLDAKFNTPRFRDYLKNTLDANADNKIYILGTSRGFDFSGYDIVNDVFWADVIIVFTDNFTKSLNYLEDNFNINQGNKKIINIFVYDS